jgi:hypothetical protein
MSEQNDLFSKSNRICTDVSDLSAKSLKSGKWAVTRSLIGGGFAGFVSLCPDRILAEYRISQEFHLTRTAMPLEVKGLSLNEKRYSLGIYERAEKART